ncbi:hypothetical protein LJB90_02510 [Eubacteriales bacterium OttesenSCG-928-G02]|nr:hypothetical protein [Eubacteriales bacterium OttesenSCG-928-G02]
MTSKKRNQKKSNEHPLQNTNNKTKKKPSVAKNSNKGGFSNKVKTKLFGQADAPQTAQQSIPYKEMYRDGLCRVNNSFYTKTIVYLDINYQLAQNDVKTAIFEGWCDFLNFFDSTISVQFSFINQQANKKDVEKSIVIQDRNDIHDETRREFSEVLKTQLAKGNNGLKKVKYITFGIEANNLKDAKLRLERIEADVLANFKALSVKAFSLNGLERLEILHGVLHPDGKEKLNMKWEDLAETGMSTKDCISPSSFNFSDSKTFKMGNSIGAVSFLQLNCAELSDRVLADFLDMENAAVVSIHIQSIDQAKAIKTVKRKLTDLDKMKIEEVRPDRALCEVA